MANEQNLTHKLTVSEQRAGGKASGAARRRKKLLRECLTELLEREYVSSDGKSMEGADLISAKLFQKAMDGDLRAFEIIRDTVGQQPVQRIESVTIPQEAYDRVASILDAAAPDSHNDVQPTTAKEE